MTVVAGAGLVADGFDSSDPGWVEFDGTALTRVEQGAAPRDAIVLDGAVLVPGFVDLQINGIGAIDFAHATSAQWRTALQIQARQGVTGCCPTLVSAPLTTYAAPLSIAAGLVDEATTDAAGLASVIGVHLEGPFLGGAPGAHVVAYLRPVDREWLVGVLERWPGVVRIVTLAPEADPGLAATRLLAAAGVVVAIGHSTSTYDETRAAAAAGAHLVTHLFNGMGPLHHREPGVAGAALDDPFLTPSLIADLVHVHPSALRLAIGRKRSVVLVTDAVAVDVGTVGAVVMQERDGVARLADGTLAGSTLTMDAAVRNVVDLGFPLSRVVEMASTIPSELLGCTDRGRLEPGRRADLVALDRHTLAVRAVWVAGHRVALP